MMNFLFRAFYRIRTFGGFSLLFCALALHAGTGTYIEVFSHNSDSWQVSVPEGYELKFLARMNKPRLFTFHDDEMIVGSRGGNVYRLKPPYVEAERLFKTDGYPNSIAFRNGAMLVAKTNGLYSAPYQKNQKISWSDFSSVAPLPKGFGHTSRTVKVGPNGKIYVSLGISGNCSNQYLGKGYSFLNQRGGILVLDEKPEKPAWKVYSSGLRNPIGMAWHPLIGALYASNNGPDHHGYDQPPEYFSRLTEGSFHGMPWFQFNGNKVVRDHCISVSPPREDVSRPVATFPARNAPMGVAFVPTSFSARWHNNAVVALHGSWATLPDGGAYGNMASRRPPWIAMVELSTKPTTVFPLLEGFQNKSGQRLARPVGIDFAPDGGLHFTSDGGAFEGLFRLAKSQPKK